MEKKIAGYTVNVSINNIADSKLPCDMEIEINNTLHRYVRNELTDSKDYNKARAFEYLQKILYADMRDRDMVDFMAIFTEDREMRIAYAGGLEGYDGDYIIIAFHRPHSMHFDIYAFSTYNEGDIFDLYTLDNEEE